MKDTTIILGVIGSDCHSVGNSILDAFLTERGFRVVNLGVMVSQEEFITAAIEHDAAAILVSSLYGHAELDCVGFRERCVERGLEQILLYIGGNLVVGKPSREAIEQTFVKLGFDRIFLAGDDLETAAKRLQADIERQKQSLTSTETQISNCGIVK
ncbi:MAG: methylaspartate mutase subunit S [Pirellulales bacterium]|nr:methylaspartate mutase subunit S [Pirellulales bacterium]